MESIQFSLIAPQILLAGGKLGRVTGNQFLLQPVQNWARNHEFAQPLRELAFQHFFARVRLRALALYSFTGGADGGQPYAGVIRVLLAISTALPTMMAQGGEVYELDTAGQETVLYSFTGSTDGDGPEAGVIRDSAGNLYGTTSAGGKGSGPAWSSS